MKRVLADITNELKSSPLRKVPIRDWHVEVSEFSDTSPEGLLPAMRRSCEDQELLHQRLARLQLSPEPVEDDGDDPQCVAEYVTDIFNKLEDDEIYHLKAPEGLKATGGREERASAVDWMLEVQVAYKLRTETLFLAVSLLDSFLRLNKVSQRELKLAVVCSLFVAGKFEEIDPPNVKDFVQLTYEVCSKQDILTMEATLLTSLEFSLCRPTAAHFLDRYQQKTVTCRKMMQKHGFLMQYLLELALVDSQMWRFPPSLQVAAAAVVSSRLLGPKSISRPFRDDDASAERSAMLTSCALELCRLLEEIEWSCHQAVRKKFLRPEYLSIAAMVSCT